MWFLMTGIIAFFGGGMHYWECEEVVAGFKSFACGKESSEILLQSLLLVFRASC